MMTYQDVINEASKIKRPHRYYLFLLWRGFITTLCILCLLGIVGCLVSLANDNGWFEGFHENPVIWSFVFAVPIFVVIGSVVKGAMAIWKWGITNSLQNWKCKNYPDTSSVGGSCKSVYHEEIKAIADKYYQEWESFIQAEDDGFKFPSGWKKTFVKLSYDRKYPTKEIVSHQVQIPFYYRDNYYSKDDYKHILRELCLNDGENLMHDVINPTIVTPQELFDSVLSKYTDCLVDRCDNDNVRYKIVTKDGLHTIIALDKYTSANDITDICTSSFMDGLIPSKKLSIVSVHNVFTKDEFKDECEHRRKVVLFNERSQGFKQELESWNRLIGYPYYYFYNYYPTSMSQIGKENEQIRELIFNFKDSTPQNRAAVLYNPYPKIPMSAFYRGMHASITKQQKKAARFRDAFNFMVNKVSEKISKTIGCDAASQVSFVCIPCGSEKDTRDRLEDFYRLVCERTGMDNAYQYVHGVGDDTPKHLGGAGLIDIILDKTYFAGKKVVVFDDIVTRGTTMRKMVDALENCGATVLFIITIARTTHHLSAHPIDSDPIFNETI